ncbi:MAG TPA: hypothetical protein VJ716_07955 [Gaiellaceae bacterium]|nr:hypothetical protein [Gaiellaceae bacterium]
MRWLGPAAAAVAAVTIGIAAVAGAFGGNSQPRPVGHAPPPPGAADVTKSVPCYDGHQRQAGPNAVRRFHAVTAVSCVEGTRIYPGHGEWWVRIRREAAGSIVALQKYFEQPDEPNLPKGGFCDDVGHAVVVPTFVDGHGHWLVPRIPVDGCHEPLGGHGPLTRAIRWHVVGVRKLRLMTSAAALATHCAQAVKDEPAGGAGRLDPAPGGRLFATVPKTLRVCLYRTENDFETGSFIRGFNLDASQTRRLLPALTGPGRGGACRDARMFATVRPKHEPAAEVELGGCWRVARPNLNGLGSADAAVVRAILSAG